MALSGSFIRNPIPDSNFGLYCTWTGVQSAVGNYTDITLKTYLRVYNISVGTRSASTTIDGKSSSYVAPSLSRSGASSWTDLLLNTRTERVSHNADGSKSVTLSSYYAANLTYSGTYVASITASGSFVLDAIDRTAPAVTLQTSDITGTSVKITANSDVPVNRWEYSTNNGASYVMFSTSVGTTASMILTGLAQAQTYTLRVRARKASNNVYGASAGVSVTTLGSSVINSVNPVTIDAESVILDYAWTVYDASYTHTLSLSYESTVFFTLTDIVGAKGTTNSSINLDDYKEELLSATSNSASIMATLSLHTYDSNGAQIGETSSKSVLLQTSNLSAPEFDNVSGIIVSDTNTETVEVTGDASLIVQNHSNLTISGYSATAKNGASIDHYEVSADDRSVSAMSTSGIVWGSPTTSGVLTVTIRAVDSRGYMVSQKIDVTVIEYSNIELESWSIERINSVETTARLILEGNLSSIDGRNVSILLRYRYKAASDGSFGAWNTLIAVVNTASFSFSGSLPVTFDADYSYDIEVQVSDAFTSDSELLTLPMGIPLIAYRSKKIGINNANPSRALDVVGGFRLDGQDLTDFVIEQGTSGIWTYRKWHSGMAECWKFTQIQINVTTAAGSLYYSDLIPIQLPFAMTDVTFTGSVGQLETLVNPGQPDAEHINFRVMRCTQHSYNTDIALLVKGRWKEAEA